MQTISHYLHPIINHFAVVVNELHVLHSIHRLSKDYLHILCGCHAVYGMMRVRYDPNCARNRLPTVSHRLHIVVDRFYVVIDDLCSALTNSTFSSTRFTLSLASVTLLSMMWATFRSCAIAITTSSFVNLSNFFLQIGPPYHPPEDFL